MAGRGRIGTDSPKIARSIGSLSDAAQKQLETREARFSLTSKSSHSVDPPAVARISLSVIMPMSSKAS